MKIGKSNKLRLKQAILSLVILAICGAASFSGALNKTSQESKPISTINLPGVSGESNNIVFVYDRYALVAPHAPSIEVNEATRLNDLDNNRVYLIDTKKPDSVPIWASLDSLLENCHYPTKIQYDEKSHVFFVRGTHFEATADGDYEPFEVISYLDVNLDDNGKPVFGARPVTFKIDGRGPKYANDAPSDFVIGRGGDYLVFSNGASIFTYNRILGIIEPIRFVHDEDYGPENRISYLGIDKETDTVVVTVNKKEDGKYESELHFYRLEKNGTLTTIAQLKAFPGGASVIAGSSVAIGVNRQGEVPVPESAYFVLSDGALCQVDLDVVRPGVNIEPQVRVLKHFDELKTETPGGASPRFIQYDDAKKILSIVKSGNDAKIVRPVFNRPGKRGKIVRPVFFGTEAPAVVFVQLKKNKVIRQQVLEGELAEGLKLTDLIFDQSSRGYLAAYTGNLYAIDLSGGVGQAAIGYLAQLGPRVDHLAYLPTRAGLATINSFSSDEEGARIVEPGSVVLAQVKSLQNSTLAAPASSRSERAATVSGQSDSRVKIRRETSITRPCYTKKLR